ncbi:carbohydrate sulfotransferase 11-like [Tubulanus polymorphus]|uniref:carbohydrate sulfotransferase 11-like n=1 Tax=Tubulanus polymorphus TaxID=672921 RepID=UPI003DA68C4E
MIVPISTTGNYRNLVVDKRNKIIYCKIAKVGTTVWKNIMLFTNGRLKVNSLSIVKGHDAPNVHTIAARYFKSLGSFSKEEQKEITSTYFKFLFVRHPLERLLSAYLDKVKNPWLRKGIAKYFKRDYQKEYKPSFKEFVEYSIPKNNNHWNIYNNMCHPCEINYDFIGKYGGTIENDFELVQDHFKLDPKLKNTTVYPRTYSSEKMKSYYKDIPQTLLNKIHKKYKDDFILFNYEFNPSF